MDGNETLENVTLSRILYTSEGFDVEGYICKPKDVSVKYPLILWNRGGDENNGKLDNFLCHGYTWRNCFHGVTWLLFGTVPQE